MYSEESSSTCLWMCRRRWTWTRLLGVDMSKAWSQLSSGKSRPGQLAFKACQCSSLLLVGRLAHCVLL